MHSQGRGDGLVAPAVERDKLQLILDYAPVGIWMQDGAGKLEFVNRAFCDAMGIPEERFLAAGHYKELIPAEFVPQCLASDAKALASEGVSVTEQQLPFADGRVHDLRVIKAVKRDARGEPVALVGIALDITEELRRERELEAAASRIQHINLHDTLTGLPNRVRFQERMEQGIARSRMSDAPLALFLLSLDNFGHVNDSHGHPQGDRLLEMLAKRIRAQLPSTDMVARLNGDEFAILRESVGDSLAAGRLAQQLLDTVAQPIVLPDKEFHLAASIGVALFPDDADNPQDLLRNSDAALTSAKREARGHYRFYSPTMGEWVSQRARMENDLRAALRREELTLWFQPQVDAANGRVVGVEALLRWQHAELGWVSTEQFIAVAEEAHLIAALGAWVLREACLALRRMQAAGAELSRVAVNVSAMELHSPDYAQEVFAILAETGVSANQLELEVTERAILSDLYEVCKNLASLREQGVRVAIDDFGTGYSSLAMLRKLRIDCLKIDRAFVEPIPRDADASAVIHAVLAMSQALRLEVVAEGVERLEQAEFLTQEGCTTLQGYLHARPMPEQELIDWLQARHPA